MRERPPVRAEVAEQPRPRARRRSRGPRGRRRRHPTGSRANCWVMLAMMSRGVAGRRAGVGPSPATDVLHGVRGGPMLRGRRACGPPVGAPREGAAPRRRRHAARRAPGRDSMKRLLALFTALALLAALPATASAARPTRFTDHVVCRQLRRPAATSGGGFVFFSASASDRVRAGRLRRLLDASAAGSASRTCSATSTSRSTSPGTAASSRARSRCSTATAIPPRRPTFTATLVPIRRPGPVRRRLPRRQPPGTGSTGSASRWTRAAPSPWATPRSRSMRASPTRRPSRSSRRTRARSSGTSRTAASTATCRNAAGDTGFLFVEPRRGEVFVDACASPPTARPRSRASADGALIDGVLDATARDLRLRRPASPTRRGGSIHLEIVGTGEPFSASLKSATSRLRGAAASRSTSRAT